MQANLDAVRGFLNKWEMHKALAGRDIGPAFLPFTRPFKSHAVKQILHRKQVAYIKPVDSWGGNSIYTLARKGRQLELVGSGGEVRRDRSLYALLDGMPFAADGWIVQRRAPIAAYEGRPVDFRVHMQRELDDTWVRGGVLARVGGLDSIVSNVGISRGRVIPADDALRRLLAGDSPPVDAVVDRMWQVGGRVCEALNEYRYFQEIGIDIGVSHAGQLWVFEVNTDDAHGGPSLEMFRKLPDSAMFDSMLSRFNARKAATVSWLFGALFES